MLWLKPTKLRIAKRLFLRVWRNIDRRLINYWGKLKFMQTKVRNMRRGPVCMAKGWAMSWTLRTSWMPNCSKVLLAGQRMSFEDQLNAILQQGIQRGPACWAGGWALSWRQAAQATRVEEGGGCPHNLKNPPNPPPGGNPNPSDSLSQTISEILEILFILQGEAAPTISKILLILPWVGTQIFQIHFLGQFLEIQLHLQNLTTLPSIHGGGYKNLSGWLHHWLGYWEIPRWHQLCWYIVHCTPQGRELAQYEKRIDIKEPIRTS